MKKTLFDKVWDAHVVDTVQDWPQVQNHASNVCILTITVSYKGI